MQPKSSYNTENYTELYDDKFHGPQTTNLTQPYKTDWFIANPFRGRIAVHTNRGPYTIIFQGGEDEQIPTEEPAFT